MGKKMSAGVGELLFGNTVIFGLGFLMMFRLSWNGTVSRAGNSLRKGSKYWLKLSRLYPLINGHGITDIDKTISY